MVALGLGKTIACLVRLLRKSYDCNSLGGRSQPLEYLGGGSVNIRTGLYKFFNITMTAFLIIQMTACGTLLYPERRGQKTGQIDVGVTILDGIGLLFFVVPGVVAFAVDFASGAIFLPPGTKQTPLFRSEGLPLVYVDLKDLNRKKIEAVIAEHTGHLVSLNDPGILVSKLKNHQELIEQYERFIATDSASYYVKN